MVKRNSIELTDEENQLCAIVHTEVTPTEIRIYLNSIDSNGVEHKPLAYMLGTNCIIRKIK